MSKWEEERKARLVKAVKGSGLNEIQVELLGDCMRTVWEYIGSDYMQLFEGRSSIPRSYVLEAVTDADRMRILDTCMGDRTATLAAVDAYYKLNPKQRTFIDKYAFPDSRYGL